MNKTAKIVLLLTCGRFPEFYNGPECYDTTKQVKPGQEYLALRPKPRITELQRCSPRRGRR